MEYVYSALLLHKLGKDINEHNIKSVLTAAGVHADEGKIKSLVASLSGVDIAKELESASLVAAAPASGSVEHKKEEKKEEKSAPAAEGLSALFG